MPVSSEYNGRTMEPQEIINELNEQGMDLVTEKEKELQAEIERLKKWNKWFYGRVRYMRELQKKYYKERSNEALRNSKALEHEVDQEIARIERNIIERQQQTINFNNQ